MLIWITCCQTVFQDAFTILHSHQQYISNPVLHILISIWYCRYIFKFWLFWYVCSNISLGFKIEFSWWLIMLNIFLCICHLMLSSVKYQFVSFAYFLLRLFSFLLLNLGSNSYILDSSPLLYMWFANVFSQFVACVSSSLHELSQNKCLLVLERSSFSVFPLDRLCFHVTLKNFCLALDRQHLLIFFLKLLWFYFYI